MSFVEIHVTPFSNGCSIPTGCYLVKGGRKSYIFWKQKIQPAQFGCYQTSFAKKVVWFWNV